MKDTPLLLVHGYPFSHTMWFSTIAALGSAARVLAPDLPGFGKAPVLSEQEPSLEAMADFLASLLDEKGESGAVVAGMSMGGYVALAFAEKYPERLHGLGLISSQTLADTPEGREGRFNSIKKIREQGPSFASEAILPKMFADGKAQQPTLRQYAVDGANAAGIEGLCWALEAMAGRPDRTKVLHHLKVPVLILHGAADKIVPVTKARELAHDCQDPIYVELPGVGHASPLEAPDRVAQALEKLMSRTAQRPEA